MAKNSYKANVNQYANQEEAIRKAKGNPNKNIHSKKKNSNYGGYTTGAYMAQTVAEKVNQQEKVKLPTWLNVTLIAEFAVVLVILILRLTAFKDSAVMTHLSSLTLGITCGTLFYIRKYKHTKKTSAMYSIITIMRPRQIAATFLLVIAEPPHDCQAFEPRTESGRHCSRTC